ncbi:hypothetical protein CYA_2094 [Synechococcus sp. JA-3-3Ab]|nr:hypothetical protein CYA_2094 [Synechococcus sp. JA-3-3Ab]
MPASLEKAWQSSFAPISSPEGGQTPPEVHGNPSTGVSSNRDPSG